jgi:hypothetical protein
MWLALVLAACATLGGAVYLRSGDAGAPAPPERGSAEQAILTAARDRAGDPALSLLFDDLNARHFAGQLPSARVMWDEALDSLDIGDYRLNGMTDGSIILLKPALRQDDAEVRRTLCHEMVHVKLIAAGDRTTAHDEPFQAELQRIFADGCFEAILASPEEKAALKVWIDGERTRLDAARAQADAESTAIRLETERVDRSFADLNARIEAANAAGSGWPSRDETAAAERLREALNERIQAYNSLIAANQTDQTRFNEAVQRYNLMLAYPDGLAEDRAKGVGIWKLGVGSWELGTNLPIEPSPATPRPGAPRGW